MFGSSSRLFSLLNSPLALFHHRPSTLLRLAHRHSLSCPLLPLSTVPHHILPLSLANSYLQVKSSQQFHSQTTTNSLQGNNHVSGDAYLVPPSHPWPEWSDLLESISTAGYFDGNSIMKDEFVPNESLSMEFVDAASSCLGFARDRPDVLGRLPKKDIQVLIDDGAPYLFKSAIEIERRMRSFLQDVEWNEATTVDLMKYILSYASSPIIYPERSMKDSTESSARNLLREMANFSHQGSASLVSAVEETPRNLGPNITMKRGDWICPKCNFVNFAKNSKCLECQELRPHRHLTGSEWDCPQCNFFNYGRNVMCLRCECRRPGEAPLPKIPSERQLTNSQYRNNFGDDGVPNDDGFWRAKENPETAFNCNQGQFNGDTSTVLGSFAKDTDGGQDARKDGRRPILKGSNSSYSPFVPLPADMFAKKPEKTTLDDSEEVVTRSSDPAATASMSNELVKVREDSQSSEKSTAAKVESRVKDANEEEKADRWFKKMAELHDVTDLASAISDDDFPEIMPMRKGENRFVVSKKKDRSQTSPAYKRQQAMQQGSNSNFVPFVPFPPDYFAKKDNKQHSESTTSTVKPTHETSSSDMSHEDSMKATRDMNLVQGTQNQGTSSMGNLNSRLSVDNGGKSYRHTTSSSSTHETSNVGRETPENRNVRSGWEGKSLEGSAVKETDPLDMSEEAKAERWFRRVAQIKDISELSQIPDEDFPSIMPMRKGVNRFVVSKRKTPLERRLTSPQYRKNLQPVSSDPTNTEGDGS